MKRKERKRKVFVVIGFLFVLIGMMIWFHIPYSPVKSDFQNDIDTLVSENQLRTNNELKLPTSNLGIKP